MLNLAPANIDSMRHWPWERFSAIFTPPVDILENGWLRGRWTTAQLEGAPRTGSTQIHRTFNSDFCLSTVKFHRDGQTEPSRSVALEYDRFGRLVTFHEDSEARRIRLEFQYDRRGHLVRETSSVSGGPGEGHRVDVAELFYDAAGKIRRVVVRDREGNLRECRLFNGAGTHIRTRLYHPEGRLEVSELISYDLRRKVLRREELRYSILDGGVGNRLESRRIDVSEYDDCGGLRRRTIVDERNRATGLSVAWCRVVREVIQYNGAPVQPISDRTEFFNQWPEETGAEAVFEIAIHYEYDREGRLARTMTTESDLLFNLDAQYSTLHEHRVAGTPGRPESLKLGERPADRRVLHEYHPDGLLSRRSVSEGSPRMEIQSVIYE